MTATASDPLHGLHDVHLPAAVSWWPPAPGWWALAALLLVLCAAAWWTLRRYRASAARRGALRELKQLQQSGDNADTQFAAALNRLLRRYALACFPREQVAGLSGEHWLAFLDHSGGLDQRFQRGPGRQLLNAPYRRQGQVDRPALVELARLWIRQAARRHP